MDADGRGPQSSVKNVFIRGSVVRYVHLPGAAVDTALLEDATRRGTHTPSQEFHMTLQLAKADQACCSTEAAAQASKAK